MAYRSVQKLNERELEANVSIEGSWHSEYRDSAYIYFGSLPYQLTEGDILIVFSQYGIPVHLKLVRDKDTGKSEGFGWLKYEDQRSTILAVDNLNGTKILDRIIRVDHAFYEERDRDEEYEDLLANELKTDFADPEEEEEKVKKDVNKDDVFADPLLLMKSIDTEKTHEKREHRHRHRSHHYSDRDGDRQNNRHRDRESRHSHRHRSKSRTESRSASRHREREKEGETKTYRDRDSNVKKQKPDDTKA